MRTQNYSQSSIVQNQATIAHSATKELNKDKANSFADILALTNNAQAETPLAKPTNTPNPASTKEMLTGKGTQNIDLDSYFSNKPISAGFLSINDLPPILLPSAQNIKAITEHVSTRFTQLLADYNIPSAPEKITFDTAGKMQIPIDYPYTTELNQALEENTGVARELQTLNAISSHAAEIQDRMPFINEMADASSKSARDRIIAKYSHLLHDNHSYKSMALVFSKEGAVSVTADGKPLEFT